MRLWIKLRNIYRNLFHRAGVETDLHEELEIYLEDLIERKKADGLSPNEARRTSLVEIGGLDQVKEECRHVRLLSFLDSAIRDVLYAVRTLRKSPAFTLVAILTVAFGIGATTSIFSIVHAALLTPLPYHEPGRLAIIRERILKVSPTLMRVSAPDIAVMQRESKAFESIAAFKNSAINFSSAGEPERIRTAPVSANLFSTLGEKSELGRSFAPGEDNPGHLIAVLNYKFWQSRFGGDPSVISQSINLDNQSYTVIGVMPKDFEFPPRGLPGYEPASVWLPLSFTPEELSDVGDNFDIGVIARLKPNYTIRQASAEMEQVADSILKTWGPVVLSMGLKLETVPTPLPEVVTDQARPLMYLLIAAVTFLLCIACSNVAGLLVSRAVDRRREIALRQALGASRWRITRQLLTESILLSFTGGALGLMLAVWETRALVLMLPTEVPNLQRAGTDVTVAGFAVALSVLTGVLFGLTPAFTATRTTLNEALQQGGRTASGSRQTIWIRNAFVVGQLGMAVVLLVSAGLLIRSFVRVLETNPGVRPDRLVTASIALPIARYPDAAHIHEFLARLFERAEGSTEIQSMGVGTDLPTQMNWDHIFTPENQPITSSAELPHSAHTLINGSYLRTLGVPLVRGRWFSPEEEAGKSHAVIVSEDLARRYWPGADPVGKRLKWGHQQSNSPWLDIVGVVGNVQQRALDQPIEPHTYEPYLQVCNEHDIMQHTQCNTLNVAIRSSAGTDAAIIRLRDIVRETDANQPVTTPQTMQDVLDRSIAPRKFNTILLALFAGSALLLSAIGLYGVLAYRVSQQTHEIGIRIALGAARGDVRQLIFGSGLTVTALGLGAGCVGAWGCTRLLSGLLFEVPPSDLWTYASVTGVFIATALLACYFPARRAAHVDPIIALRHD